MQLELHASEVLYDPITFFQCGHIMYVFEGLSSFLLSHCLHTASTAASCNPRRYHPENHSETNINETTHHIKMKQQNKQTIKYTWNCQNNMVSSTYWDVSVEWFPISLHICLSDVQHVDLRAGHHDTYEGCVLGPRSLSDHHKCLTPLTAAVKIISSTPHFQHQCRK